MPSSPSPERLTADAMVQAFNNLDIPTILSLRTENCTRTILPTSLSHPPQPISTYAAQLHAMKSIFTTFHVTVNEVIEGVSETTGRKSIVMFVVAHGDTKVGQYRNEYVWRMEFEDGGGRVSGWVEFVDVGVARDFGPKLREAVKGAVVGEKKEGGGEGS